MACFDGLIVQLEIPMKTRMALVALLLALFGLSTAFAAPAAVKNAKLSVFAKTRDRDAKGRFLPIVKQNDVEVRAYGKYEARMAKGAPGTDKSDYYAAKGELQAEAQVRSLGIKLGKAWGAKVAIGKK
jgi:hypothetical protein